MKHIVVLASGSASSVRWLVKNDPNYGKTYTFVAAFVDNPDASCIQYFREVLNIDCIVLDIKAFYVEQQQPLSNLEIRPMYYNKLACMVRVFAPDLILLSGFMSIITNPFLIQFQRRIINVHPADLRIKDLETHKRKYTGAKAVKLAYEAGERSMRSTIHFLDDDEKKIDEGEIICVSDPHETDFRISWQANQEIMKTTCDGSAYMKALPLIWILISKETTSLDV
jgi:folate-dependent phosphoribosylglycinamide formyltransferase PurN